MKGTIMKNRIMVNILLTLLFVTGCSEKSVNAQQHQKITEPKLVTAKTNEKPDPIDSILQKLNKSTSELKTYQCRIEYLLSQPAYETKTLRKGNLFYMRDKKKSNLRVDFDTRKEDDEKQRADKQKYLFDGVWLTYIDYQMEQAKIKQMVEPNDPNGPADAFELVSQNFPIVGFSKAEDLKKQFDISLLEQKASDAKKYILLHLKVKPNSIYKDDYSAIDFRIDKKLYLPAKITAVATELTEFEVHEISFLQPKLNRKLKTKTFDFQIPPGFDREIIRMKK
jgi:outer membrane lipoprotein-sorting protein